MAEKKDKERPHMKPHQKPEDAIIAAFLSGEPQYWTAQESPDIEAPSEKGSSRDLLKAALVVALTTFLLIALLGLWVTFSPLPSKAPDGKAVYDDSK